MDSAGIHAPTFYAFLFRFVNSGNPCFTNMTVLETLYDYTKGQEGRFQCVGTCRASTFHEVLASVDLKMGFLGGVGFDHYQVVRCRGCLKVSFRYLTKRPNFLEPVSLTRKTKKIITTEELYPPRSSKQRPLSDSHQLPEAVGRIYRETFKALTSRQPVLTGIGIRALIEAVCKERSASGKNLQEKIDNLVTLGLLTRENADFLHGLRILGNQTAHEVVPHSKEKLGIAAEVVEHLLTTVYLIPLKAKKLKDP
jgi:hypothetical protein